MESRTKVLQIIRLAMLASIVFYAGICRAIPSTASANPIMLRAISVLAVMDVVAIVVLRRLLLSKAAAALAAQPSDEKALARYRTGYIVIYAVSESISLYGVVLHFLGFPFGQVAPFLLASFLLIMFFRPRQPSNEIG